MQWLVTFDENEIENKTETIEAKDFNDAFLLFCDAHPNHGDFLFERLENV